MVESERIHGPTHKQGGPAGIIGGSERNQRELERRAAVVNRANYAIDANLPADNLAGVANLTIPAHSGVRTLLHGVYLIPGK